VLTLFITHRAIHIFVGDCFTKKSWDFNLKIEGNWPCG